MSAPKWGAFVPQGWKQELAGLDAATAWATAMDVARRAEELGYDHLWVYDHVETVPRPAPTHVFEAWMTLAAVAHVTSCPMLGQMVTCAAYRNPGLLAKQAACLDVMSGGRLIFGIGAGWYRTEYEAYGWPFPGRRERLAILEETIRAVRLLWQTERASFAGRHVRLEGAFCDPKPLQQRPAVWVGGGGERVTLRIAAELADATNWQVGLDGFVHKSKVLAEHCARVGRNFEEITRTHAPDCIVFDSEADMRRWLDSPGGGHLWGERPHDEYVRDNFVGTVEQVAEKARAYVEAGCREFVLWFRDYPSTASLEAVATAVAPLVAS